MTAGCDYTTTSQSNPIQSICVQPGSGAISAQQSGQEQETLKISPPSPRLGHKPDYHNPGNVNLTFNYCKLTN